ncbi:MAG TPA: undecaprenyl-diphosphate phosphatase, partial [Deltaproteobacteria bacterium]|nr:undecaprenyl-diphosphate phosphatase [Deltaproteobacteria bacterium]
MKREETESAFMGKHRSQANASFSRSAFVTAVTLAAGAVPALCLASEGPGHGLGILPALVLGVVEGITEYLPVSSTGHLYLASRLLGLGATPEGRAATDAYVIAIQIGAILAVLWLYPGRVASMIRGCLGRDRQGLTLALNTLAALLPAAAIGLALEDLIKERLFATGPVTLAWLAGGVAILLVARKMNRDPA